MTGAWTLQPGGPEKKLTALKTRTTGNGTNARSVSADDGPSFILQHILTVDAVLVPHIEQRGWDQAQMFSPLSIDVIVRLTAPSRPDTHFATRVASFSQLVSSLCCVV